MYKRQVYGGAGVVPVVYSYLLRNFEAYAPDKGNVYQLAAVSYTHLTLPTSDLV